MRLLGNGCQGDEQPGHGAQQMAEVVRGLAPEQRRVCCFIIGKCGSEVGEERRATVLLDLLPVAAKRKS